MLRCVQFVLHDRHLILQEEDDENEEDAEGDEGEYEEVMVSRNLLTAFMEEEVPQGSKRRAWDDEFVLKRQFSALIPAFDPRPGRTNINQVITVFLFIWVSLFST